MKKILITGGSGFIGTNLINKLIITGKYNILNIDNQKLIKIPKTKLNYNENLYKLKKIDICNFNLLKKYFLKFLPDYVIHLAAESHVDNSIESPKITINTNIIGTYNLLEVTRIYINDLNKKVKNFKFIHVSTDEVYGSLNLYEKSSNEKSVYKPNSPYSASKASSDYLVRSWNKTYKIPSIITHCTNNYGPYQFAEKLIPKIIKNCIDCKPIPIYGNGKNIRDWIHVYDHVDALIKIMQKGKIGKVYNIGSNHELTNNDLVKKICNYFDLCIPKNKSYKHLITYVSDRKGHDKRYSLSSKKIKRELNFSSKIKFNKGINETIDWYLKNSYFLNYKK